MVVLAAYIPSRFCPGKMVRDRSLTEATHWTEPNRSGENGDIRAPTELCPRQQSNAATNLNNKIPGYASLCIPVGRYRLCGGFSPGGPRAPLNQHVQSQK
jgi:hypothetical protein